MSDEIERTLCQLPHVHVFRIPVRKSADGHRASDWPKDPAWTGKLKIVGKGRVAAVILLDDKNQVFANCTASEEGAVERTLDSGRYFVLRITNAQGRHAFIGIAFNERNDAFDFNVALSEFKSELEREDQASKISSDVPLGPMKDLSLKDGEKIKIKINKKKSDTADGELASNQQAAQKSSSGLLLPPPKSSPGNGNNKVLLPPPSNTKNTKVNNIAFDDGFGSSSFGSSDPFASTANNTSSTVFGFAAPTNNTTTSDPFAASAFSDFDTFTSSSNTAVKPSSAAASSENILLDF